MIDTLAAFGIEGQLDQEFTGVWCRLSPLPNAPSFSFYPSPAVRSLLYALTAPGCVAPASGSAKDTGKIAAVGVGATRWVTSHGLALNVQMRTLEGFGWIVPCAIEGRAVACMEALLPDSSAAARSLSVAAVREKLMEAFERQFNARLIVQSMTVAEAEERVQQLVGELEAGGL